MELRFNVVKEERKALVTAIGEITDCKPRYCGAPGFVFVVGGCSVSANGTVTFEDVPSADTLADLLAQLTARGFAYEKEQDAAVGDEDSEAVQEADAIEEESCFKADETGEDGDTEGDCEAVPYDSEDTQGGGDTVEPPAAEISDSRNSFTNEAEGKLSINTPLSGFNVTSLGNLENLVTAKAWILKKMARTDALPIERDEEYLRFPWFSLESTAVEVDAYSRLVARLGVTAKEKQRITATERRLEDGDNEKFKARCFLLSLGFIGQEYAQARKILLAPMNGSGSFKQGSHKKESASESATIAHSGEEMPEAIHVREIVSEADKAATPPKCGECWHHCYHTDGLMRTKAGDVVDTSKRTPDSYTHYCLGAPSGFRKLKHANDWSGCETAPKWCPMCAEGAEVIQVCEDGSEAGNAQTSGEEAMV